MIIGGLDVGTSGCKMVLYDENAVLVDTYYYEYATSYRNGEHEIDFADVKNGVMTVLGKAVAQHCVNALGVTSFGETFAMLDENDNILAPSMLYTDPRGEEECTVLAKAVGSENYTRITGVAPHPMYSIAKMMWQKKHRPEAFAAAKHLLLGEDFIVYTLTGRAVIDHSLAARTAAFDIEHRCWSKAILDAAGIEETMLSTPVPTGSVAGEMLPAVRRQLGIDYPITVVNGGHDQVAAMIGCGVFDSDSAMDGTGTVECIPVVLPKVPQDPRLYAQGYSVVPYLDGSYACYALSFTGGATLKWFRDRFAEAERSTAEKAGRNVYAMLDERAPAEPTGILVLPHFAGAATPYMDPDAKAAFVGITLETDKFALYRALMEGTSYEIRLNFDILTVFAGNITRVKATGGGASSDLWLQIKADIIGADITALSCAEVGATGTAALCGVAVGAYVDLEKAVAKMAPVRRVFTPNPAAAEQYRQYYAKYKNLYSALKKL